MVVFTLIGASGPALPLLLDAVGGRRAATVIARAGAWLERHGTVVVSLLIAAIGASLVVEGLRGTGAV